MKVQADKRYLFHGHAIPLAGRIRRPNDLMIQAVAPTSAPITGGRAHARVENPPLPGDIVSVGSAESTVEGDFEDPAQAVQFTFGNHGQNNLPVRTRTHVLVTDLVVTVKGPNSSRQVKADRVELEMISRSSRNGGPPSIQPVAAEIRGLQVDGMPLHVHLRAKMFSDHDTKEKLCRAYESDDKFHHECGHMFFTPQPPTRSTPRKAPVHGGFLHGTLADRLEWTKTPHPDAVVDGHSLFVPDFGYIYFGEIFVNENSRRVTLMRMHLGSPDGGELLVADSSNNGAGWPPT